MATTATAGETVRLVHELSTQIGRHVEEWATPRCLTVAQAFMLRSLDKPTPMSLIAEVKGVDPSSLTGMIDRMEKLGLVERTAQPDDRRVRLVAITAKGEQTRIELEHHMAQLPMLAALTAAERTTMLELLRKACGGGGC